MAYLYYIMHVHGNVVLFLHTNLTFRHILPNRTDAIAFCYVHQIRTLTFTQTEPLLPLLDVYLSIQIQFRIETDAAVLNKCESCT